VARSTQPDRLDSLLSPRERSLPVSVEDKETAQPDREEALDKSSPATSGEMHIPDYVMLDFGEPEGTRTRGKPLA
jgi:hypothetical protein